MKPIVDRVGANEHRGNVSPCFGPYIAPFDVHVQVHGGKNSMQLSVKSV